MAKKPSARLPVFHEEDDLLWERQGWDTPTSYNNFLLYYFPLRPPRNVTQAYRNATGKKSAKKAPTNWYCWFRGLDPNGGPKFYRHVRPDGSEEVRPVPGWAKRAEEWDRRIEQQNREKFEREKEQLYQEALKLLKVQFAKLLQAWAIYQPGQEKMGELATSSVRYLDVAERLLGSFRDDEPESAGDQQDELGDDATQMVTDMDRIDQIAGILDKVRTRRDGQPAGPS